MQSIENLIKDSQGKTSDNDETTQSKFAQKQKQIKLKEMERQTSAKADALGLPYMNLFRFPISPEALSLIPEEEAYALRSICFYYDGVNIRIGTIYPEKEEIIDKLEFLCKKHHCNGGIYVISPHSLKSAWKLYATLPKLIRIEGGVEIKEEELRKFEAEIKSYKDLESKINDVNISEIVTLILATAMKTNSSDIHIEAEHDGVVVRFRIDGVLQEAAIIKKEKWKKIISRMKLLAKVKINVDDKPQDGRYTVFLQDDKIDIRSSFLPTAFGESVVMRLLKSNSIGLSFDQLGLIPQSYEKLNHEIQKPNGLILTTGPTGSGKTTTLYAVLNKLNKPGTKIITLEDPIEYQLKGINQSQVNPKENYTFANGLRSILRQDPDIIMIGEIRDLDTAEIAVQASLTGHLVLSTLHTNDSSGVIPRLIDIGVKPYFLTPSINAVIGQRLVRKLCPHCKIKHDLDINEKEKVQKILAVISPKAEIQIPNQLPIIYKAGPGCEKCSGLAYKGRIGIYEIFTMSDNVKELTSNGAPAFKILKQLIEDGMITMLQDGVLKCLDGLTSLEEIYRVIGKFDYIDSLYDIMVSDTIGRGIKISEPDLILGEKFAKDINSVNQEFNQLPNNKMLAALIASAVKVSAGDIHIEPTGNKVKIRFRIDGILHDIVDMQKENYFPILSEIKILAGFPTNVKKASWDGRFAIFMSQAKMDCRLSIISGGYGETVVIRLLTNQAEALDMKELGMRPYILNPIQKSMKRTKGVIITSGPTGSGKTTTLYSILNRLNKPDVKIITVEDPIEYHLEGIMQTQIDPSKNYTFEVALKSLLRQNPNIMMIGEIRDAETAKIAIEASMTGHLVLSTIHANSAVGAIARLLGLGINKQILSSSVECSIGQRLVRKICTHCKEEVKIEQENIQIIDEYLQKINKDIIKNYHLEDIIRNKKTYKGAGCEKCGGLGYKGRVGIYEVVEMSPALKKIIQQEGITDFEIEEAAINDGAVTMMQDGILKVITGETTIEEILRVVD